MGVTDNVDVGRPQRSEDVVKVLSVVGARPNFVKLAPIDRAIAKREELDHVIVHTGQHYDDAMSAVFFRNLNLPEPHYELGVGVGTHAEQTGTIMQRFEPVCLDCKPDIVLVYGDVNSTVAAALVAAKMGIVVGHIEAGLRSRDWSMPEEINRVVTDRLANLHFVPSRDAEDNLRAEGVTMDNIHFVGNVMIDSLILALPRAIERAFYRRFGLQRREYIVATVHRPSIVDDPNTLRDVLNALVDAARKYPVILPMHPRTRRRLKEFSMATPKGQDFICLKPLGYLDMLSVVEAAGCVLTDSGGLQEETSYLGIPCVTVRPNTERPITITQGTNRLVSPDPDEILASLDVTMRGERPSRPAIEKWDGQAAERIVAILCDGGGGRYTGLLRTAFDT